jgi:hypothetical protein
MNHHLFKNSPPLETLIQLLREICPKEEEYFIVDAIAYKKMVFSNKQELFLDNLLPCYHKSKQHYITRDFTYNSFVNIIRQICIYHNHSFVASKKYNHSVYNIRYIIDKPK